MRIMKLTELNGRRGASVVWSGKDRNSLLLSVSVSLSSSLRRGVVHFGSWFRWRPGTPALDTKRQPRLLFLVLPAVFIAPVDVVYVETFTAGWPSFITIYYSCPRFLCYLYALYFIFRFFSFFFFPTRFLFFYWDAKYQSYALFLWINNNWKKIVRNTDPFPLLIVLDNSSSWTHQHINIIVFE